MIKAEDIDYLSTIGEKVIVVVGPQGRFIRDGDDQFKKKLKRKDLALYREKIKEEMQVEASRKISEKYPRYTDAFYMRKLQEAETVKSKSKKADKEKSQSIKQEAKARGITVDAMSDLIIDAAEKYNEAPAKIESLRVKKSSELDGLKSTGGIYAARIAALKEIEGL